MRRPSSMRDPAASTTRMAWAVAAGVALAGLALRCSRAPTRPAAAPQPAASARVAPTARPVPVPSSPPIESPPPLRDGCLADLPETATATELLAELENRCVAGMERLAGRAAPGDSAEGTEVVLEFELLDGSRCVRFIAVGDRAVDELDLVVLDDTGSPREHGDSFGRFALLAPEGSVCLDPGRYRAVARAHAAAAELWLAGFIAR